MARALFEELIPCRSLSALNNALGVAAWACVIRPQLTYRPYRASGPSPVSDSRSAAIASERKPVEVCGGGHGLVSGRSSRRCRLASATTPPGKIVSGRYMLFEAEPGPDRKAYGLTGAAPSDGGRSCQYACSMSCVGRPSGRFGR
jgi:hypothetical protein